MLEEDFNPRDYLNNVILNWNAFCLQHKNIAISIEMLLKENAQLKRDLMYYEKYFMAGE